MFHSNSVIPDGDPAESVLHFLSDVLSSPDPRLATRFLGVLPSEGTSSGKIFTSILSKLTLTKSAYCSFYKKRVYIVLGQLTLICRSMRNVSTV